MAKKNASFFQKHRTALVGGGVVLLGLVVFLVFHQPAKKKPSAPSVMSIMPLPPPPPPPPPPPTPPPQDPPPEPQTKQPDFQPEEKPEPAKAPPPEPNEPPPAALGTALQGEGGDSFGLSGNGNGMIGGTGKGGKGGSSKWGWYAGKVQSSVVQALQSNRRTRSATLNLQVRVWADSTGRITRATLVGSSGDAAVDKALQSEVLAGLQLSEAPPADMPMPIVLRISARRPN